MVVALLVIGIILGLAGINGQLPALGAQVKKDLLAQGGQVGFIEWAGAILGVSIITKNLDMPEAGKLFMALIVIVYLLKNEQVITQAVTELKGLTSPTGGSASGVAT